MTFPFNRLSVHRENAIFSPKSSFPLKSSILGVALLSMAFGSAALTLGRVRGAAWVGLPLDMVIPIQIEAGEDIASSCFEAEVFHADARQDASRVRVLVESGTQPNTANLRVLSSATVDEPVVTIYLRAVCGQKITRRYVLLADMPSEIAAPLAASEATPATAPLALNPVSRSVENAAAEATSPAPAATAKRTRASRPASRPQAAPKRLEAKAAVVASKPAQSRLTLDAVDLSLNRGAITEVATPVVPSEEAQQAMQKMQALEGDVKALLASAAKSEASILDLKTQLLKAESERFSAGLVYGLMALVLACLAALALLWNRQRRVAATGTDWWRGASATPISPPSAEPVVAPKKAPEIHVSEKQPTTVSTELSVHSATPSEFGFNLMDSDEVNFNDLLPPAAAGATAQPRPSTGAPQAAAPQPGEVRNLHSETLLAIRQQAEFFASLGQTDRAVRILKKQITESAEPNPFVYLDLLSLFHSMGSKTEFQLLREDFHRLFTGRIADFSDFKNEGNGLEFYPDMLSGITALWSTTKGLAVLESCIFQGTNDAKSPSFDLAAFRDLLLLHAVAESVVLGQPPRGPGADLDLDLSEPQQDAVATKPAPVSAIKPLSEMGNLIDFDLPDYPTS
jgi:hypothetical protein